MSEYSANKPLCSITGTVVHGPGIGRFTGIPTADLSPNEGTPLPEPGVYISRILLNGQSHYGVTHIGPQPTLNNTQMLTIETLILDFRGEIYGCHMQIELFRRLRTPEKYDNVSLLLEQIRSDCAAVRKYWGIPAPLSVCVPASAAASVSKSASASVPESVPGSAPESAPESVSFLSSSSDLRINTDAHTVCINSREIYLTPKEFQVFFLLYSNPDTAFTKEEIYEAVWREPANGFCHAVENTVFQIRKKLRPLCGGRDCIRTLTGYGYRYCSI